MPVRGRCGQRAGAGAPHRPKARRAPHAGSWARVLSAVAALLLLAAAWAASAPVAQGAQRVLLEEVRVDVTTPTVTTRTSLDPARSYVLVFSGTATRCLTFFMDAQGKRCGEAEGAPSQVDPFYCISPCSIVVDRVPPYYNPFIQVRAGSRWEPNYRDVPVPYNPAHEYAIETQNGRLPSTDWLNVSQGPLTFSSVVWAPGLETGGFTVRLFELVPDSQPAPPPAPASPTPTPGTTPVPGAAPDLAATIPAARRLRTPVATAVVPGVIALTSLRRSACVRVDLLRRAYAGGRPIRAAVTLFTGSTAQPRVVGQGQARLTTRSPAGTLCIPIPARARAFTLATRLSAALYTDVAGARTTARLATRSIALTG